jgi:hypothetical protein
MPFAGAEDIPEMLDEFGGDATFGTLTKKVLYDETDAEAIALETGGSIIGKRIVLRGRTGDWPAIKIGDTVTVKTKGPMWNYSGTVESPFDVKVREMKQEQDGAVTAFYCTKS